MEPIMNYKGSLCQHRFMICQEGFCSECMIHLNTLEVQQQKPRETPKAKQRVPVFAFARSAAV